MFCPMIRSRISLEQKPICHVELRFLLVCLVKNALPHNMVNEYAKRRPKEWLSNNHHLKTPFRDHWFFPMCLSYVCCCFKFSSVFSASSKKCKCYQDQNISWPAIFRHQNLRQLLHERKLRLRTQLQLCQNGSMHNCNKVAEPISHRAHC